jgi:hypothetical protein
MACRNSSENEFCFGPEILDFLFGIKRYFSDLIWFHGTATLRETVR